LSRLTGRQRLPRSRNWAISAIAGRVIRIDQVPFTVIGVLEEKGHSLGGDDLDDQVMVPLTTARKRILGFFAGHPTAIGGLTLRVADGADMARTSEAVRDLLRERHRLAANSPDDFILRDLAAEQRAQSRSAWLMTLMLAGAAAVLPEEAALVQKIFAGQSNRSRRNYQNPPGRRKNRASSRQVPHLPPRASEGSVPAIMS
jgi:MacB-like periplasmic core domain